MTTSPAAAHSTHGNPGTTLQDGSAIDQGSHGRADGNEKTKAEPLGTTPPIK